MCGIAGMARMGPGGGASSELVTRMCDAIRHRGPDDSGVYRSPDGRAALGHRRLSILDLSPAGRCPMPNGTGTIWITYNGEVYNHAGARAELETKGYRYRSHTDTETLLYLYEELGVDFLERLRGMFAFALWDEPKGRLVLARDRLGIKPLYYTQCDGWLLWASEIKALLQHPGVPRQLDEAAFAQYLTFAATPPPQTLFQGIHKLAPGERLVMDRDGRCVVERWWTPLSRSPDSVAIPEDTEAAVASIGRLLEEAVVEQTMADVPHGLLLSGGLDSTLILAMLTRHLHRPVRTFSIGYEGAPRFDERVHSRAAAALFGSEHVELVLPPAAVMQGLPELVEAQDEPMADWVCLPTKALTRAVRDAGVIVVQVGEGSDELFTGYRRYQRYAETYRRLWRPYAKLPGPLRRLGGGLVAGALAPFDRLREVRDLFLRAGRGLPLFVSGAVAWWDSEKAGLLSRSARTRLNGSAGSSALVERNLEEFARLAPRGDFVAAMTYQDLAVRLPELLLMRVDKMTMLNSVEARVPFLDHRLVELAFALSAEDKLRENRTKYLVKRVAEAWLPAEVVHRRKVGFDVPISQWLRDEPLSSWAAHTILDSALLRRDLLDTARVKTLLRAHQAGKIDGGFRIWNLVNACAWYDRWIEAAVPAG